MKKPLFHEEEGFNEEILRKPKKVKRKPKKKSS